jgi:hypothetical protein
VQYVVVWWHLLTEPSRVFDEIAGLIGRAVPSEEFTRSVMAKTYKPGEKAPISAQYEIVGPRGGRTGEERTVAKGETLPPPPKPGQVYIPVDPTMNKSGRM